MRTRTHILEEESVLRRADEGVLNPLVVRRRRLGTAAQSTADQRLVRQMERLEELRVEQAGAARALEKMGHLGPGGSLGELGGVDLVLLAQEPGGQRLRIGHADFAQPSDHTGQHDRTGAIQE